MNTLNIHADPRVDDDDDEFGEVESRPLLGWFLMAVALVTMAFLIGAGPDVSAQSSSQAPAAAEPNATSQALTRSEAAGLAYGG
jgi:hypothetical protein